MTAQGEEHPAEVMLNNRTEVAERDGGREVDEDPLHGLTENEANMETATRDAYAPVMWQALKVFDAIDPESEIAYRRKRYRPQMCTIWSFSRAVEGCYTENEEPCLFPFRLERGGPLHYSCIYEHDPQSAVLPGFYWCPTKYSTFYRWFGHASGQNRHSPDGSGGHIPGKETAISLQTFLPLR